MELFILRIAGHFNHFHTIQKRTRNGLCRVCCRNKQDIGQIQRNFHIVITELHILLTIQYFQKCRRNISFVIAGYLIDLVQKHQRIGHACLTHCLCNTARHGAHVCFSVTADLRLIMDTAKTDADIFFTKCTGNASCNGSLTCSRRSYKTNDRCLAFFRENTHCQILQHTLFHFFESIMILFQYLFCVFDILIVFRLFLPRQFHHGFNVCAQNIGFLTSARHHFETIDLFFDFFFYFFVCLQLFQLF